MDRRRNELAEAAGVRSFLPPADEICIGMETKLHERHQNGAKYSLRMY